MANPFDMLSQLQAFRDQATAMLEQNDPAFVLRAGSAMAVEWVLQAALAAGPPPSFAADLAIDDAQARVLYTRVLTAALRRRRELANVR